MTEGRYPHTIALNAKDEQRLQKLLSKNENLTIVDIFRAGLTAKEEGE
jgi:hypothetical protein